MNLYSIVLCNNGKYNNNWCVNKDQYSNDILVNESISQKIKVGKYLTPTLSLKSTSNKYCIKDNDSRPGVGQDTCAIYNFSDDGHYVINKKNFTLTMIKNSASGDTYSNIHLIYVTIPTESIKIIESEVNLDYAEIINSYRGTGMNGGIIQIDSSRFPNSPCDMTGVDSMYSKYRSEEVVVGHFLLYDANADENKRIIDKTIILRKDLSHIYISSEYITSGIYKETSDAVIASNFFKKITISPTMAIRTSVYLINESKVDQFNEMYPDEDVTILSINPKVLESKNKESIESLEAAIQNHIVKNKVRAITVVGIKLPKEFYSKYRILLCFVHDLNSGIIKCIKS